MSLSWTDWSHEQSQQMEYYGENDIDRSFQHLWGTYNA